MKNWKMLCGVALLAQSQPLWAVDVAAVLQWSQRVELSAPVSGVVQAVQVDVGDQVKKGQTLLSLDNTAYQAKVAENRAAVQQHRRAVAVPLRTPVARLRPRCTAISQ